MDDSGVSMGEPRKGDSILLRIERFCKPILIQQKPRQSRRGHVLAGTTVIEFESFVLSSGNQQVTFIVKSNASNAFGRRALWSRWGSC